MKTFLLLILVIVTSFGAHAQYFKNRTGCTLRITPICYYNSGIPPCSGGGTCALTIHVAAHDSVVLPACTMPVCSTPNSTGYLVGYGPGTGCNTSVKVGDPNNPCPSQFPASASLPPCSGCGSVYWPVFYDGSGNLIVQ
jgi:hypothetical protein